MKTESVQAGMGRYLTDSDLSHLILFARLRSMGLGSMLKFRERLVTPLAKSLIEDLNKGCPSKGNEVEYNRVLRIAQVEYLTDVYSSRYLFTDYTSPAQDIITDPWRNSE